MKPTDSRCTTVPTGVTPLLLALTLAWGAVAGCANRSAPVEQIAVAKAALNEATTAGAGELAPVEFRSAMEKMDAAERAMGEGDHDRARRLAEQAEVDARLASTRARSARAQKAADAVQENIRVLRQEIERSAP